MQTTNIASIYTTNGFIYIDNPKHKTESIKNKTKHIETIGDFDNKGRCLYIYFSLGNNYNLLNFVIEKSFSEEVFIYIFEICSSRPSQFYVA